MRTAEPRPSAPHQRRLVSMWVVFALAVLGLVAAPTAQAATGPGTIAVTATSRVAGATGVTVTLKYTAPASAGVTGTVNVVVPTSGAPTTAFAPIPSAANMSVQVGTCSSAALAPSPFTPTYKSAYPGDSPGTRVSTRVTCGAGKSFTITYRGVTLPRRAQGYTFFTTVDSAAVAAQPVLTITPGSVTRLAVTAPASSVAGVPFAVTVAAKDAYYNVVTGYLGTVKFTSTDAKARVLPSSYTFTAGDKGIHAFTGVTLVTTGAQRVTATDTARASLTGTATVQITNANVTVHGQVLCGMDPTVEDFTVTVYDVVTHKVLQQLRAVDDFNFMFANLPAGQMKFGADAPGFAPGSAVITAVPGQTFGPDWDQGAVIIDLCV